MGGLPVFGQDGAGLGVAYFCLRVGGEGGIVVTDDERMRSKVRAAAVACVGEPVVQAFFAHQAVEEVKVGLKVLGGEGAWEVLAGVKQVELPGR